MKDYINNKYNNLELPGSFSGLSGFLKNNKKINKTIAKDDLLYNPAYTLHQPVKKKFQRRRVLVNGKDDIWQADLVDMSNISKHNYSYKFILTCIDVFSKYGWAVKIKNKSASEVLNAFKIILKDGRLPNKIHVDGGNEFKGVVKQYFEKLGVSFYITNSKLKASVVERYNRTLKSKMYRFFTYRKNLKIKRNKFLDYIHYLPQIVSSYNNSYHSSIKEKPINVSKENEDKIFFNLYKYNKKDGDETYIDFKFKVGENVRVAVNKAIFEKGYTSNWSTDIFVVKQKIPSNPPTYKLISLSGDLIEKSFYTEELQKVYIDQFPYESFEVIDQDSSRFKIKKLSDIDTKEEWIDKQKFRNEFISNS